MIMARMNNKELIAPILGSGLGVVTSRYGSNALSDALTKKDREANVAPADVSVWKKAWFVDLTGGAGITALGYFNVMKNDMASKTAVVMGSNLLANGLISMVDDLTADAADKQYNGRSLRYVGVAPNRVTVGAQARRMAYVPSMARSMAQIPTPQRSVAALF